MGIDELNVFKKEESEPISIDTYFEDMEITDEQKEERKEAANDLWWALLLLFATIKAGIEDGDLDYAYITSMFGGMVEDIVEKYSRKDDYTNAYIRKVPQEIIDTTWDHLDLAKPDSYWTSGKRAVGVAVNEANSILNYEDLQKAIDEGKTHKTWKAEIDPKTRDDHRYMNGKSIPIREYFVFPDCKMMMPHDEVNGTAAQIVNCRCALKYEKKFDKSGIAKNSPFDIIKDNRGTIDYEAPIFEESDHAKRRKKERGISDEDIQDALKFPLADPYDYYDLNEEGEPYIKYIGEKTTVIVNPEKGIIATVEKPDKKLIRRLMNGT